MKKIPLSKNKYALIDDEDFERVSLHNWYFASRQYAVTNTQLVNGKSTTIRMHRYILQATDDQMIDHINGDGLDNRRENLRFCTLSQNQGNRKINKNSKTGFKGVSLVGKTGRYRADIQIDKKNKFIGTYITPEEAARKYNEYAERYFGKFALLNKI